MTVAVSEGESSGVDRCPRCEAELRTRTMRTAVWQGDRVAIVEDVPAHVCDSCSEQFYDGPVSDALRRLAEAGFPSRDAKEEIRVPVFSLRGRIVRHQTVPEDVYVD